VRPSRIKQFLILIVILLATEPVLGHAEIDKVYHPYITPLEREFEWRITYERKSHDGIERLQRHRFAFGASVNDRFSLEAYIITERLSGNSFELEGYELDGQLQLSEQGEFWADWGLLFELEREEELNSWEVAFGVLSEKEWGKWSTAVNLTSIYEFGSSIENELEIETATQLRYRWSRALEPALEFYWGEENTGIGPVIMGLHRFGLRKLKWELGIIFTTRRGSRGQTIRSLIEYEF